MKKESVGLIAFEANNQVQRFIKNALDSKTSKNNLNKIDNSYTNRQSSNDVKTKQYDETEKIGMYKLFTKLKIKNKNFIN